MAVTKRKERGTLVDNTVSMGIFSSLCVYKWVRFQVDRVKKGGGVTCDECDLGVVIIYVLRDSAL